MTDSCVSDSRSLAVGRKKEMLRVAVRELLVFSRTQDRATQQTGLTMPCPTGFPLCEAVAIGNTSTKIHAFDALAMKVMQRRPLTRVCGAGLPAFACIRGQVSIGAPAM